MNKTDFLFLNYGCLVYSQDVEWDKINTNSFWTFGGDAQFVAVRKGLVEYRQKSLDFDPSSAIAAGSALTEAGLSIAAAVAMGKMPVLAVGDTAATTVGFNEVELQANQELLKRREVAKAVYLLTVAKLMEELEGFGASITQAQAQDIDAKLKSATQFYLTQLEIPAGEE